MDLNDVLNVAVKRFEDTETPDQLNDTVLVSENTSSSPLLLADDQDFEQSIAKYTDDRQPQPIIEYDPGMPVYGDENSVNTEANENEYDPTAYTSIENTAHAGNYDATAADSSVSSKQKEYENDYTIPINDSTTSLEENDDNAASPADPKAHNDSVLSEKAEDNENTHKDDSNDLSGQFDNSYESIEGGNIPKDRDSDDKSESSQNIDQETPADEMIKDIFGDDSDVDEGNEKAPTHHNDDNDGEDGTIRSDDESELAGQSIHRRQWDFDIMMQKKKNERAKRRSSKRRNDIVISDQDDLVKAFVENMKMAANKDRTDNEMQRPALEKRKMLPLVIQMVRKTDLQEVFLDYGLIDAFSEWLAPLPDKGLPSLEVRQAILRILHEQFLHIEPSIMRKSGIGKALMLIVKHPKETRENKEKARKIIGEWARPIFNLETSYHSVSREEREQRDFEHLPLVKRRRVEQGESSQQEEEDVQEKLRPGDVGFIPRARVPRPSTKDYVHRPRASLDAFKKESKTRCMERYETTLREFKSKNKSSEAKRAVSVNLSGNKMR